MKNELKTYRILIDPDTCYEKDTYHPPFWSDIRAWNDKTAKRIAKKKAKEEYCSIHHNSPRVLRILRAEKHLFGLITTWRKVR